MELVKKLVSVNQGKCQGSIQLTLDDDFNVPDRKPDVRQIVAEQGEIHTNEVTPGGDKVQLDGTLQFQIFYISEGEGGRMQGMNGEIPFREWVNLPEACQGQVLVKWILEDLSVEVINSRKISVRAIVTAHVKGEEGTMEEIVSDLSEGSFGGMGISPNISWGASAESYFDGGRESRDEEDEDWEMPAISDSVGASGESFGSGSPMGKASKDSSRSFFGSASFGGGSGASGGELVSCIQSRRKMLPLTQQRMAKKDTFRVKDEYILPAAKPDIEEIVYQEDSLRGEEIRLQDDKFSLKGELYFMIFYYGGESDKLQFLELELPFSGTPECIGCTQDMIPDVEVGILKKDIQIKPDEDGEERILDVEVILELSVKTYGEEKLDMLEDFYATDRSLEPVYKELELQELSGRYSNKLRLNNRIQLPESAPGILQLCGTSGTVKVDECSQEGNSIRVEGIVELPILYITPEDATPVYSVKGMLPFEELIPIEGFSEQDTYEVKPVIDQVALSLLDGREIDAKATLNLDTFLFRKTGEKVITGYTEAEIPEEEFQNMPGITGYYVQDGDSWWTVGRKYRVPVDKLKRMNEGLAGELEPGMRLLVQKESVYRK